MPAPIKNKSIKKIQQKRNRSRSRSPSPQRLQPKINNKPGKNHQIKSSKNKIKGQSPLNRSLAKSQSKGKLNKSLSEKNLKKSASKVRLGSSVSNKNIPKNSQVGKSSLAKIDKSDKNKIQKQKIKTKQQIQVKNKVMSQSNNNQRDMGIIFVKPEHDKIVFKILQITDGVFDKYLQMINNDNDANYVINALPELRNFKKQDQTEGRDFVSGRISRLSGIFQNLSVDKIITPVKKTPNYYSGQCGKNISILRILLQTKFKVEVDVGFLQYSVDGDKLTIFRIYVSKIYRRMNYLGFIYLQTLKILIQKHSGADRWSIFILQKNVPVHKFFKYLGFHIQKIATESKNKMVDYFQEFTTKKKELSTIVGSMLK